MLRSVKPHSSRTTPGASRDRWKAHAEGASIAAQMIISGKPCQPKDCASMVIESASLNLKYPFGLSLSKPCTALDSALSERFKQAQAGSIVLNCY